MYGFGFDGSEYQVAKPIHRNTCQDFPRVHLPMIFHHRNGIDEQDYDYDKHDNDFDNVYVYAYDVEHT